MNELNFIFMPSIILLLAIRFFAGSLQKYVLSFSENITNHTQPDYSIVYVVINCM